MKKWFDLELASSTVLERARIEPCRSAPLNMWALVPEACRALAAGRFPASVLAIVLTSFNLASAQQAPVPVENEPHHHMLLKNESVEVMRVTLAPGERTLYHRHSHDGAAVRLSTGAVTSQKLGEEEGKPEQTVAGGVTLVTRDEPYTHRVHNLGPGDFNVIDNLGPSTFDVIDEEFLVRPRDASNRPAAEVAAENPSARAYKWLLTPGASSPRHTHERPYLIISVTGMQLKMTAQGGQSLSHEVKAGDFHWVDAKVTHTLTNAGSEPGQIVEIELSRLSARTK